MSAPGHDDAVHHGLAVDELAAGRDDVRLQRRVRRGPASLEHPGGGEHQRSVAQVGDRLVALDEVPAAAPESAFVPLICTS